MKRYGIDELGRVTESIFGALVEYDEAMQEINHWKNAHAGMVSAEKAVFADLHATKAQLNIANERAERFRQLHGDAVRAHAQAVWDQPWEGETPDGKIKAIMGERDKLKAEVERMTQALDHQRNMAGTMLREAERNARERDIAVEQLSTAEDQMGSDITEARSAHIEALRLIDAWDKCDDPMLAGETIENLQAHRNKYRHLLK